MRNLMGQPLNDIPLGNDVSSCYVSWIIGLMVFLSSLVYMGSCLVSSPDQWRWGGSGRLTVEVPLHDVQNPEDYVHGILAALQNLNAVEGINVVDNREVLNALDPWLGQVSSDRGRQAGLWQELTLPVLIDVDIKDGHPAAAEEIRVALNSFSPDIYIEKHSQWQESINNLRFSLESIAYLFMALIAAAVIITVTLVTRSSLDAHAFTIDALRLMGATNNYIAVKFQRRAFWLALKGGLWGIALALPALLVINWYGFRVGGGESLRTGLKLSLIAVVASLPFIAGVMSLAVARLSVLKTLLRLG